MAVGEPSRNLQVLISSPLLPMNSYIKLVESFLFSFFGKGEWILLTIRSYTQCEARWDSSLRFPCFLIMSDDDGGCLYFAGLNRCGKSCRLRWTNYLRPDIKRGKFSPEEEKTILNLHAVLGNKYSLISSTIFLFLYTLCQTKKLVPLILVSFGVVL